MGIGDASLSIGTEGSDAGVGTYSDLTTLGSFTTCCLLSCKDFTGGGSVAVALTALLPPPLPDPIPVIADAKAVPFLTGITSIMGSSDSSDLTGAVIVVAHFGHGPETPAR